MIFEVVMVIGYMTLFRKEEVFRDTAELEVVKHFESVVGFRYTASLDTIEALIDMA